MSRLSKLTMVAFAGLALSACGDDNDSNNSGAVDDNSVEYQVTVSNLTNAQPFSPLTVVLHDSGALWSIGESASEGVELIAESGDNSGITSTSVVTSYSSSDGVLAFGQSTSVNIEQSESAKYLSLITMLVNTNDAFSGLNQVDVSELAVNESISYSVGAYDAGTEANSEADGTIPGPADGGEGYNAARDDIDVVTMHPGVISSDDGLSTSVLTYQHKFDNPVMAVTIMRVK